MGRSVSTLRNADDVAYIKLPDGMDQWDWQDFMDNVRGILSRNYPSLDECNRWEGREDHIFMENRLCEIAASEYCGLVAISIRAKEGEGYYREPSRAMGERWVRQVFPKMEKALHVLGTGLYMAGRFSNGEAVFTKA